MLFDLHVRLVPEEANEEYAVTLPEALEMISDAWKEGRAQMAVGEFVDDSDNDGEGASERERANILTIQDMRIEDDGTVTILFDHGDSQATDPAIKDFTTRKTHTVAIKENEGLAHGAHMIISTSDSAKRAGRGRAVLERVPNLGKSVATTFLNRILRDEAKLRELTFEDPKTRKAKKCHPRFLAYSQLSSQLKEDLQEGRLKRINFITHQVPDTFEERGRVVPHRQTIVCNVVKPPSGSLVKGFIDRMRAWGKSNNFEEIQIEFTKDKAVKGKQNLSARLATDIEEAEDAVYSRLEVLQGFDNLEQSPKGVVDQLQSRMKELFSREGLWK